MRPFSLFIIILSTLTINNLFCQVEDDSDAGVYDFNTTVDWGDPIYNPFFQETYSYSKENTRSTIGFKQCDTRWGGLSYGNSSCGKKICSKGCALTCMAMILASYGFDADPQKLQTFMQNKWFGGTDGCSVVWQAVDNYTGNTGSNQKVRFSGSFVLNARYHILRTLINKNGYAIVWVKSCGHWVLVYGYTGSGADASEFLVYDPGHDTHTLGDNKLCLSGAENIRTYSSTKVDFYTNLKAVLAGTIIQFFFGNPSGLKSTDEVYEKVWVVKNSSGAVVATNTTDLNPQFKLPAGTYTISLAILDINGFGAEVKSSYIVVNPAIVVNPGTETEVGCHGLKARNVTRSSFQIFYSPQGAALAEDCLKITGPNVNWKGGSDYYWGNHEGFDPNSEYRVWTATKGIIFGKYTIYDDCNLVVRTIPMVTTNTEDLSLSGNYEDLAFSSITLAPGFEYIPIDGNVSYSASIAQGDDQWYEGTDIYKSAKIDSTKNDANQLDDNSQELSLFPNPTNGLIYINSKGNSEFKVYVLNSFGQVLLTLSNSQRIDLSELPSGVYFVKIITLQNEICKKVIKQ